MSWDDNCIVETVANGDSDIVDIVVDVTSKVSPVIQVNSTTEILLRVININ